MKRIIAVLLALTFVFAMFAMTACAPEEGDGKGTGNSQSTGDGTEAPKNDVTDAKDNVTEPKDEGTEPPEDDSFKPGSIAIDKMGVPAEGVQYFEIAAENVIHDGKGTWSHKTETLPTMAFDGDSVTIYDCDEGGTRGDNTEAENVGIPYDGEEEFETGYVGAYFADGIYLTHIRYAARWIDSTTDESKYGDLSVDYVGRMVGGKFQVSVDGVEWVDAGEITEAPPRDGACAELAMDASISGTVYKYVRYVGPKGGYCNIGELEIWGKPAK